VQDRDDGDEPAMARSALRSVAVDHCVPVARLGPLLTELSGQPVAAAGPAPERLRREQSVSVGEGNPMDDLSAIGTPSSLSCPDCSGALFEINEGGVPRYRCHTGHAFGPRSLQDAQKESTEEALWSAVRALHEKETLLRKMADLDRMAGDEDHAVRNEGEARRVA